MTETNITRRVAILSFMVPSLAGGLIALPGCGGEKELPVIDSKKPKDELQQDIENPYGAPTKPSKPIKSKRK